MALGVQIAANANLPQRPTYAPFDSFDEVALVMDFDPWKRRANWQDSLPGAKAHLTSTRRPRN